VEGERGSDREKKLGQPEYLVTGPTPLISTGREGEKSISVAATMTIQLHATLQKIGRGGD